MTKPEKLFDADGNYKAYSSSYSKGRRDSQDSTAVKREGSQNSYLTVQRMESVPSNPDGKNSGQFNVGDHGRDGHLHKANAAHIQKSLFGQKGVASRASNPLNYGSKTTSLHGWANKDEINASHDIPTFTNQPIGKNSSKNIATTKLAVKAQLRKN